MMRVFHMGWLILGLTQMGAFSSGNASYAGDPLFSADPIMPVRISRTFFEKSLTGEILIRGQAAPGAWPSQLESAVTWQEFLPSEPAPQASQGQVLADFRDHVGCADFQAAQGVRLCFNLMGDVDSVGLNPREVRLRGVRGLVQSSSDCSEFPLQIRFLQPEKTPGRITLNYLIGREGQGACAQNPVEVQLVLRQI